MSTLRVDTLQTTDNSYSVDIDDLLKSSDLSSSTGGSLVGVSKDVATTVQDWYKTTHLNAVLDFGMAPDFDPTTGVANGTNNVIAAQAMMDALAAMPGKKVVTIPDGNYYFNFDDSTNPGNVGVMWGRVDAGLKDVTFLCDGAVWFSGSVGRLSGIFSAQGGIEIIGLRVVGYGGGTLAAARERDQAFALAYSCKGVTFRRCHISNFLGDCIYLGGSLDNGALTGLSCQNIDILDCTLRERYGNGIRSYYGGSRSRLAIAVIDVVGLRIKDNTIVGTIDFEPNANGQRLQDIEVQDNSFYRGRYTPYTGTNPFQDERMDEGNQTIRGGILFQSVAPAPVLSQIVVAGNYFDYGFLRQTSTAISSVVWQNNSMHRGLMAMAHDSGSNNNSGARVYGLDIGLPLNGQDDDVFEANGSGTTPVTLPAVVMLIQGNFVLCEFKDIRAGNTTGAFSYLFYIDPAHTANDNGRNLFRDCSIQNGSVFNFTPNATSQVLGNLSMPTSGVAVTNYRRINSELLTNPLATASITASGALTWETYRSNKVGLTASTTGLSITSITAPLQIGTEIQLRNVGTNSVTIAHSSSLYLKGEVNVVLDSTRKFITLQYIDTGTWSEVSRSF